MIGASTAQKDIYINIRTRLENKGAIKETQNDLKKLRGSLLGASLSALFFGMAMKNAAMNVWKSTTKTFQEIAHSVQGTVTQFDLLNGSMAYLKFSVGEALEPLAASLVPIIDKLTKIVQENPKLVAGFVKWGIILGTTLMVLGQLGTAFLGLLSLGEGLKAITLSFKLMVAQVKLLSTWLTTAKTGMMVLNGLKLTGLLAAIITVSMWIWRMGEAMGGVGELGKSVVRGLLRVWSLLADFLIRGVVTPLQTVVALAARAMDALGSNVPSWMTKFVYWQPPDLTAQQLEYEKSSWMAPEKGYATGTELVPKFYIDTLNVNSDNVEQILAQVQAQTQ